MKRIVDILKQHRTNIDNIKLELFSYRCYGDDKLKKPNILKGLKPIKSFEFIGKKVNVYYVGNGKLMLHFGTLFSKLASFNDVEDMSMPTSALAAKYNWNRKIGNRFVYPDAWCTIYNRNEGYIMVYGLMECFRELYGIHLPSIADKVYSCIRELSLKDCRFLNLGATPIGCDSCDYSRLCTDLVEWMYLRRKKEK